MSVFNGERYLVEAVRSVLSQTFRNFELIAIDDGSTDRSKKILASFAAGDERIRLVSHENRGLTRSLNEGCALARGKFIARMDSDDISWPTRFESQLAYFEAHPEIVACGTGVALIDPNGLSLGLLETPQEHDDIVRSLLTGNGGAICHPSFMVRRHAFQDVSGYDEAYRTSQDLDLFLRLGEVGRLGNVPDTLLSYRIHLESSNFARRVVQLQNATLIVRSAMKRRDLPNAASFNHGFALPTAFEYYQRWAKSARQNGHRWRALQYAVHAWLEEPLNPRSYGLLVRACIRPRKSRGDRLGAASK